MMGAEGTFSWDAHTRTHACVVRPPSIRLRHSFTGASKSQCITHSGTSRTPAPEPLTTGASRNQPITRSGTAATMALECAPPYDMPPSTNALTCMSKMWRYA